MGKIKNLKSDESRSLEQLWDEEDIVYDDYYEDSEYVVDSSSDYEDEEENYLSLDGVERDETEDSY